MTVDLKTLAIGDTVKISCGGTVIVASIRYETPYWILIFEGTNAEMYFIGDGRLAGMMPSSSGPFDIVEIIPRPDDQFDSIAKAIVMRWVTTDVVKNQRWLHDIAIPNVSELLRSREVRHARTYQLLRGELNKAWNAENIADMRDYIRNMLEILENTAAPK